VKAFAAEYSSARIERIEWIDDSSLNLVYESSEIAAEALRAFSALEIPDISQLPILQLIPAKKFPLHPQSNLQLRIAVLGDRKQAGARDRSRYYLLNPQDDPTERQRRGRKYRDRDDGGYRSRRYDDREQRNRQKEAADAGFDASLYDDDEIALAARAARRDERSGSGSSSGDFIGQGIRRQGRYRGETARKELFPGRGTDSSGRLRDRSASPGREDRRPAERPRNRDTAASENRLKAQLIKAQLREAGAKKELFPHKAGASHRRSSAFDAADETADLFASRMSVPFLDGGSDVRPTPKTASLASRITSKNSKKDSDGFSIRGAAKVSSGNGFAIKGTATESSVKELFPSRTGGNSAKELFSERLDGRGARRQKAEDLFY